MKKKYIVLLLFLACVVGAAYYMIQKQRTVWYTLRETLPNYKHGVFDDELFCKLYFRGNKYWISLWSFGEDVMTYRTISYGTYSKKNGKCYLRDSYTGFETVMTRGSNYSVVQSVSFLEGKHFVFLEKEWTNWSMETAEQREIKEKAEAHLSLFPESTPLQFCVYQNEGFEFVYKLRIEECGTFQLYLCNLLLHEGKWIRDGNILELHGNGFSVPYYLVIGDHKLTGVLNTANDRGIWEETLYPVQADLQPTNE